jgi:class 3 adenylate cyclase
MAYRNTAEPDDSRIEFRIGVNLGDIIIDGDDIHGDGVNIAARLEALAEPGGICIERTVLTQTRGKVDFPVEDIGEQALKLDGFLRIYADCGNLKDARANNFQLLSCFCQTCRTPILVLVTLPSSSLSDTHR